jgi:hypothetical protein
VAVANSLRRQADTTGRRWTDVHEHEFGFELGVCQWAERHWPAPATIVARQLGTTHRRWDTVVVEADPGGLAARAAFGDRRLDSDLLRVVRHAPAEWAWYRDALPEPSFPWRYVREAVNDAADRGLIDRRRRNGRVELRRRRPYPDWIDRVIAIENKPDLDASAARALGPQIEHDIALGLADEVWVATRATDETVEPVLLEDLPVEAGVLVAEPGRGVDRLKRVWEPRQLAVDQPGTRILDRPTGGEHDQSACQVEYADQSWKAGKRREIAERAYERGWRSYIQSMRPDCRHFELRPDAAVARPHCQAKDRCQRPGECAGSCPDFEPEPPGLRSQGWPIEGGPGQAIKRLLERQRDRTRPE